MKNNVNQRYALNLTIEYDIKSDNILAMKNGKTSANNLIKTIKNTQDYYYRQRACDKKMLTNESREGCKKNVIQRINIWDEKIAKCNDLIYSLNRYSQSLNKYKVLFNNNDYIDDEEYHRQDDDINNVYELLEKHSITNTFALKVVGGQSHYGLDVNTGVIHSFETLDELLSLIMTDMQIYTNKKGVFVISGGHDGSVNYQVLELNKKGDDYYYNSSHETCLDSIFYKKGYCRNLKIK